MPSKKDVRERLELEQQFAAAKAAFDAKEKRRIDEEGRIEREAAKTEQAKRNWRRFTRKAKIAKQKADGTFMTKQEKLRRQRAEELRAQFGFTMEDGEAPKKAAPAQKLKKKPGNQKQEGSGDEATKSEAQKKKEEEAKKAEDEKDPFSAWDEQDSDDGAKGKGYRSPIICIMGHVDTGKTKLLDKIRKTNVQEGEAGGITQQIGATFFPDIALLEQTKKVDKEFEVEVPGLLIIDTPGHESFNNLRTRGSSLADFAILVIDIKHGLEPQTVESLEMLKKRKCPFVIAMNKIDSLYEWKSENYVSCRASLEKQADNVMQEFHECLAQIQLQLSERGLNTALYWENDDYQRNISIVPTSALTGEGVPDLLYMVLYLPQTLLCDKLKRVEELQCTVIEVKNIEGYGTTIDVVLLNGTLNEGDQIIVGGMGGPIVTTICALLTPQPMKEMRVKGSYVHHKSISTSMGIKITAPGLKDAVAGCELMVVGEDDDVEALKEEMEEAIEDGTCTLIDFPKAAEGVYAMASTVGSLEALLSFLQEMKIPVFGFGIGEVHKKNVRMALLMKERKTPQYAVILCFDVAVNKEAKLIADKEGVEIMTADIIYHLFDKFTAYMDKWKESQKGDAVFPVILQIDKHYRKKDPMIFCVDILDGQLRIGTPLCVPEKKNITIGHVAGIEKDKKPLTSARKGAQVSVKIEQNTSQQHILYGRHFDCSNQLVSLVTRKSIDTLKEMFEDEMKKEDWRLIIGLKQVFKIQ